MEIVKTYLVAKWESNGPESFLSYNKVIELKNGSYFKVSSNRGDEYYEKISSEDFNKMKNKFNLDLQDSDDEEEEFHPASLSQIKENAKNILESFNTENKIESLNENTKENYINKDEIVDGNLNYNSNLGLKIENQFKDNEIKGMLNINKYINYRHKTKRADQ